MPDANDVVSKAFDTAGIAGAILIILILGFFVVLRWWLVHILKPSNEAQLVSQKLRDAHIEEQTKILESACASLDGLHNKNDTIIVKSDKILEKIKCPIIPFKGTRNA